MAIEKTLFAETTLAKRGQEIYAWLLENASDLFASIVLDTNNQIVCTLANGGNIILGYGASTSYQKNVQINFANGKNFGSPRASDQITNKHDYGVKTDFGIYLHTYYGNDLGGSTLISKNNDGTIGISVRYTNRYIYCPEKNIDYKINNVSSSSSENYVHNAEMTTFTPIPFGDTYNENMLFTPFSQYVDTMCILTDDNGQKYWYDGGCALKE